MTSSDDKPQAEKDWFDKLPKKLRIALLMLLTSAVSVMFFCFGVHAYRTGESSSYAGHEDSAGGDFFWSLVWLVITVLLLAAYAGWFERNKNDPPH
jgi:polyferredoxin